MHRHAVGRRSNHFITAGKTRGKACCKYAYVSWTCCRGAAGVICVNADINERVWLSVCVRVCVRACVCVCVCVCVFITYRHAHTHTHTHTGRVAIRLSKPRSQTPHKQARMAACIQRASVIEREKRTVGATRVGQGHRKVSYGCLGVACLA